MSKYTVDFEKIEACFTALNELEAAREKHMFDEWPGQYIDVLRQKLEDVWNTMERV